MKRIVLAVATVVATGCLAAALEPKLCESAGNVFTSVKRVGDTELWGGAAVLEGSLLYFGSDHSVYVYDVTSPLEPRLLGKASGVGRVRQMAVRQGMVYIASRETGMWIVDARKPAAPKVLSRFDTIELATGICVAGNVVMLGQRQNGVEFIDVSDPLKPAHIRIEKTHESQHTLYRDGICYSGDWGAGEVTMIDARDMKAVRTLRTLPLRGHGDGIDIQGNLLYASTGHHYHDLTKNTPRPRKPGDAGFGEGHALEIFDITDPASPKTLGRCKFDTFYTIGNDMWMPRASGDYVFCADTYNGLYAVDAKDPTSPRIVGRITVPDPKNPAFPGAPVTSVAVGNGAVYLTAHGCGLAVAGCPVAKAPKAVVPSEPMNRDYREPYRQQLEHFTAWLPKRRGQVRAAVPFGDYVYVACGQAGLSVLKAEGGRYAEVASFDLPFCGDVKIRDGKLYSAEALQGLAVYDLADPLKPREVERVRDFGTPLCCPLWIWVPSTSRHVIVSDRQSGYMIMDPTAGWKRLLLSPGCPGWDRYFSNELVGGRYFAQSLANVGFKWIDMAETPPKVIRSHVNKSGLNGGCLAWRNDRLLLASKGEFLYLQPGQADNADGSRWQGVPMHAPGEKGPDDGQPTWDGGNRLAMTVRIPKQVWMLDMTDEKSPKVLWGEDLIGHPDLSVFHQGRLLVPAGYQGLLIEKERETVLFDAATASKKDVFAQDGATFEIKNGLLTVKTEPSEKYPGVCVRGAWDLSSVGRVEVEFVNGGIWGKYTLRLLNDGGNPGQGTGCWIQKLPIKGERKITLGASFEPDLPEWNKVLPLLTRVRTWALPYLIWAEDTGDIAVWNHPAAAHGVLDRTAVRQVAVYINQPRLPHTWSIRRIVAKGVSVEAKDVPGFAKLPPEKFFPCIDSYGQFKHREWPGKVHTDADLAAEREREAKDLAAHPGPRDWDKWGGWAAGPQLEATGGFRTVKLKGKWWIVDPDGHLWWSHGPVRVTPSGGITPLDGHENWFERLPASDDPEALFYTTRDELLHPYYGKRGLKRTYDFSSQNIRRKYGENWFAAWSDLAHRRLRSWSCNTIANSSDKRICLMGRTPYTERYEIHSRPIAGHKGGWWEFCDPFDPSFRAEAKRMTQVYREEFEDPWCIGFFVDNEHYWGEPHTFGVSTLRSPADQPCKQAFVSRLKAKYGTVGKLNAAWKCSYSGWDDLLQRVKEPDDIAAANGDLSAFSAEIAENYYRIIREELKRAAPGKLYLGCRWAGGAPAFTVKAAAKHCDVLSYNVYRKEMSGFRLPEGVDAPVLIGEFHFGALDRGPFCPGLILLRDQNHRAETYRNYVRTSLEHSQIVGVHWHQFSDQSTAGRFDGENMQVGWTDVCDTPYRETVEAVRDIGSHLYEIRYGKETDK